MEHFYSTLHPSIRSYLALYAAKIEEENINTSDLFYSISKINNALKNKQSLPNINFNGIPSINTHIELLETLDLPSLMKNKPTLTLTDYSDFELSILSTLAFYIVTIEDLNYITNYLPPTTPKPFAIGFLDVCYQLYNTDFEYDTATVGLIALINNILKITEVPIPEPKNITTPIHKIDTLAFLKIASPTDFCFISHPDDPQIEKVNSIPVSKIPHSDSSELTRRKEIKIKLDILGITKKEANEYFLNKD